MFTKAVYSYLFFLCSFAVFYLSIFVLAFGAFSFASFLFHSKMWCLFLGNQQFFLSLGCLSTLHFFLAGKISLPISANLHDESKFLKRTFLFEVFYKKSVVSIRCFPFFFARFHTVEYVPNGSNISPTHPPPLHFKKKRFHSSLFLKTMTSQWESS